MAKKAKPAEQSAVTFPAIPERKICILGTTPSRMMAPFGDDSWEFWTIGPGGKDNNRWDALFELHGPSTWPEGFKEYIGQISTHVGFSRFIGPREIKPRIITMNRMDGWSACNAGYPKDYVVRKYGRMWLDSQISWAIALALEEGATDIGLYGIDLESGEEYEAQFVGCRFFMDLARIAGIRLHVPNHCALLRDPDPYPDRWESVPALYVQSKIAFLEPMLGERHAIAGQVCGEINNAEGQLAALRWAMEQCGENDKVKARVAELEGILPSHRGKFTQVTAETHRIEGELEFARHYLRIFVHKGGDRKHDLTSPWSL